MAGVMDGVGGRVGDATAGCTVRRGGSSSRQAAPRTDPPTILFLITRCPLPPTASSTGAAVPHCCLSNNFTLSPQTL